MSATLGYELDVRVLSQEEQNEVKQQIAFYKEIREIIQFGKQYRLHNPFKENICAYNFVSNDKRDCIVFFFKVLSQPAAPFLILKIKGLQENVRYQNIDTKEIFDSNELMYAGISLPNKKQDFISQIFRFRKVKGNE